MDAPFWQKIFASLRKLAIGFLLAGVVFNVAWAVYGWYLTNRMEDESPPLIAALEKFRAQNGRHPETLAELVPAYVAAPPTCLRGERRPMLYFRHADGSYSITCYTYVFMKHSYDSSTKTWRSWD